MKKNKLIEAEKKINRVKRNKRRAIRRKLRGKA